MHGPTTKWEPPMTNKEAIERFMAQEPHLTEAGFFQGLSWPRDVRRAKFQEMREAMLTPYCMDQFERSCEWLKRQPRTKNLNRRAGTSYAGDDSIRYLTGGRPWPEADTSRWGLFRNPLPPSFEDSVFRDIRRDAGLKTTDVVGPRYDDLRPDIRGEFLQEFAALAQQHNPIVRRIVRRTRPMLEERGLLKRIGVIAHPRPADGLPSNLFDGQGLVMGLAFTAAHEAAEQFSRLYAARRPGAGFLKTILLRRIGSSAAPASTLPATYSTASKAPTFPKMREATTAIRGTWRRSIRPRSDCYAKSNEIWCRWSIVRTPTPRSKLSSITCATAAGW